MPELSEPQGKMILMHATQREYCVLEFEETEDGGMEIRDITEHVKELEEQAND